MKLFKTKSWSFVDIALLKWSSILFGVILGVIFHEKLKKTLPLLGALSIIMAIKPMASYFCDHEKSCCS
ncbi:MAG: hypothetical protein CVV64_16400 [Candidatus Wallbacteria bacterium HGW-Wallbacteria-1]|jgi:hypothetical protein|uniref:Uncharacterized protein n=1 Tax=Candidatus Wallbacteria bacterium HGW-Wallbacteria-1 TaxID=2013854 RepID=A0A2N1PKY1_9BACT|nr:MAG: hypothetical protein CVV64_16400 [Candidatus Wallbacteria bacterium HGW-Wallbacteria-1]